MPIICHHSSGCWDTMIWNLSLTCDLSLTWDLSSYNWPSSIGISYETNQPTTRILKSCSMTAYNLTYTRGEEVMPEWELKAGEKEPWRNILGRTTGRRHGQGHCRIVTGRDTGKNKAAEAGRDQIMQILAFTIRATCEVHGRSDIIWSGCEKSTLAAVQRMD